MLFQLQFLPYHREWISWWQRIAVVLDLALLWVLWPAVVGGEAIRPAWRSIGWGTTSVMACLSLVSLPLVFAVATFPGEWLEQTLPPMPLREVLVAGKIDLVARRPESWWSNVLEHDPC